MNDSWGPRQVQPERPELPSWHLRVAAYHDGEADAALRAEVEALLARSAEARAYLDMLRTLDAAVACAGEALPGPSAALREHGVAEILRRPAEAAGAGGRGGLRLPLRRVGGVAVAAAAALVLVAGLAWLFPPGAVDPHEPSGHAAAPRSEGYPGHSSLRTQPEEEDAPEPELLEVLDLLASDIDFAVLAVLEPDDVELLADDDYYDALASFDEDDNGEAQGDSDAWGH